MPHYRHRFQLSPLPVCLTAVCLFGIVMVLLDLERGIVLDLGLLRREPALQVAWLGLIGMLVIVWHWSLRPAVRDVRVDDRGIWVDGGLVVEPHEVHAVGVLSPTRSPWEFRRLPPPADAGPLERVGAYFSPAGWYRQHPLPDGRAVRVPGSQDVGGRSFLDRVVIVLDGHVEHEVRPGWAISTWRGAELLAAVERIAPGAARIGAD